MANYYVSQQNGDDTKTGLSDAEAWETLTKVNAGIHNNVIVSGDTIYVGPGTYSGGADSAAGNHIWFDRGGVFGNPIHILADPDCDYLVSDTPGPVRVDYVLTWDGVAVIEGFDIFDAYHVGVDYRGSVWVSCSDKDPTGPNPEWRRPEDCGIYLERCSIAERNYIDNVNVYITNCLLGYALQPHEVVWVYCSNVEDQTIYVKIVNCTLILGRYSPYYIIYTIATDVIKLYVENNLFVSLGDACIPAPFYKFLGTNTQIKKMDYNHYEYLYGSFHNLDGQYPLCKTLSEWQSVTGKDEHSTDGWAYLIGFTGEPDGYRIMKDSPCRGTGMSVGGVIPNVDIENNSRSGSTSRGCYEWQDVPETNALIYYVKKTGNDAYTGLSGSGAFRTIRAATDVVKSYDTTYIGPGEYEESIDMSSSSSYTTWIGDYSGIHTEAGVEGEVIVQTFINMADQGYYEPVVAQHRIKVFNIHFDDQFVYIDAFAAGVVSYGGYGLEFRQCRFDHGLYIPDCYGCLFINNAAWSNAYVGATPVRRKFTVYSPDCSNIFYHNTFIYSREEGLITDGACVYCGCHNWFLNNIMKSVVYSASADHDSVIHGAAGFTDNAIFDGNFYQYTGGAQVFAQEVGAGGWDTFTIWQADIYGFDEHSFEGDPLFKEDGFHIKRSSPCVDKALSTWTDVTGSIHSIGVFIDYDHEHRPMIDGFDIGCDEVSKVSVWGEGGDVFEPSQKGPTLVRNTPYREPQLKWPCTHYLSGIQHTLGTCPRCLGTGYYYDIKFDAGGLVPQVWDETKLQQELEKITLTEYNPFHPEYGAGLKKRVGQVSVDELKAIIKSDLIDAVYNLVKYQKAEANKGVQDGNFSSRELIDRLEKVEITKLSATELIFVLHVITVHGKEIELTGKILV